MTIKNRNGKYKQYINRRKNGYNHADAALDISVHPCTIRRWEEKDNLQQYSGKRKNPRNSSLDHLKTEIIQFIRKEQSKTRLPVKKVHIRRFVSDISHSFATKTIKAQDSVIRRFLELNDDNLPPLPRKQRLQSNAILKQDMVKVSKKDKKCVVLLQFVKREGRVPKHKERENEISIGTFWKHIRSQGINHPIYKQRLQSNAILKQDMEEKMGKVSKKDKCAVLLQFQSSYLRTSSTYNRMRSSSKIWRRRR